MSSTILSATGSSTGTASASATCTSAIPDKNGHVDPSACNAIYEYYPSFGAAILFSGLLLAAVIMHISQAAKFKKNFCWVIIMGTIWEMASFVLRAISTRKQQDQNLYTYSFLLVTLAPICMKPLPLPLNYLANPFIVVNAFDYMLLGRMVHCFLPSQKVFHVPARRFSVYFVWFDVLSFLVQLVGALVLSNSDASAKTTQLGIHIYMGGMGLQLFFIMIFTSLAVAFHREMRQMDKSGVVLRQGWTKMVYALYASLAMIAIRIIYRLAEYGPGVSLSNPLPSHEAFFYCLDALPIFLAITIMNLIHPGHVLVGPDSDFPKVSRAQKKAAKAEKKARKARAKLLDPQGGEYGHETELEDGLHHGHAEPQGAGPYAPVEQYHQGYQPYGAHVARTDY
ncbi:Protein RTA1 [Lachnellula arida]|uniref:Protein RTA1 n=1 Tax=Lachnellula arida TaxID=1316785 RepID=A0A8T9B391_9HELO|nr:Protein RTA1 [Lachnellula arida]